jgi:uncharacterized protein (TIGR04222 family)
MNPITLSGPAFLVFYIVFGIGVLIVLHKLLARQSSSVVISANSLAKDPYKIAYLRGGKNEAIGVATVALHDRGLLVWQKEKLQIAHKEAVLSVQRPIEKAVLLYYSTPKKVEASVNYSSLNNACSIYQRELEAQGLLRSFDTLKQRFIPCLVALFILLGLSYLKISFALAHGHSNILFLTILSWIFAFLVIVFLFKRQTAAGSQLLSDLKSLFSLLKQRAKKLSAGGETNEAALVTAVYGLQVLSDSQFPFVRQLMPASGGDGGGSSCSSSSGSSCGSSCGGGCGGCGG